MFLAEVCHKLMGFLIIFVNKQTSFRIYRSRSGKIVKGLEEIYGESFKDQPEFYESRSRTNELVKLQIVSFPIKIEIKEYDLEDTELYDAFLECLDTMLETVTVRKLKRCLDDQHTPKRASFHNVLEIHEVLVYISNPTPNELVKVKAKFQGIPGNPKILTIFDSVKYLESLKDDL